MGNCFRTFVRYTALGGENAVQRQMQKLDEGIVENRVQCERRLEIECEKEAVLDRQIHLKFAEAIREHRRPTARECLQVSDIQRKKKSVQKAAQVERQRIRMLEGSRDMLQQERDNVQDLKDVEAVIIKVKEFQKVTATPVELVSRTKRAVEDVERIRLGQAQVSSEKDDLALALDGETEEDMEGLGDPNAEIMKMFDDASRNALEKTLASMPLAPTLQPTQALLVPKLQGIVMGR